MELYLQMDQKPPLSLTASPTCRVAVSPTSSLANPLSLAPNVTLPYVTHLVTVGAGPGVVVAGFSSSPEGTDTLAAFHVGRGKIEKDRQWIGHEGGVTCVLGSKEGQFGASVVGSCGKDGVVRWWDVRSGGVGPVFQGEGRSMRMTSDTNTDN
jgi:WD40 repeat protein